MDNHLSTKRTRKEAAHHSRNVQRDPIQTIVSSFYPDCQGKLNKNAHSGALYSPCSELRMYSSLFGFETW